MRHDRRPVLVTGCTSGIGLATAIEAARAGFHVHATMPDLAQRSALDEAVRAAGVALEVRALDVRVAAQVQAVAREIDAAHGSLHGLVNNAGFALLGFLEDLGEDELADQLETNLFGLVRVTRAFVPAMRRAGAGIVVNVSSLCGRLCLPGLGAYQVSKFAVEAYTETLYHELAPFGVRVAIVEPGRFRTAIFGEHQRRSAADREGRSEHSAWLSALSAALAREVGTRGGEPVEVARQVVGLLSRPPTALRHPIGSDARRIAWLLRLLPERSILGLVARKYGRQTLLRGSGA